MDIENQLEQLFKENGCDISPETKANIRQIRDRIVYSPSASKLFNAEKLLKYVKFALEHKDVDTASENIRIAKNAILEARRLTSYYDLLMSY